MKHEMLTSVGVTILLAEDDRRVRGAMEQLFTTLADLGVVVTAPTADLALRRAAESPPGVAVIDLHLPDLASGLRLLSALHESGWSVLAMSAHSGVASTAFEHGAAAFVDKGVDPDEFVRLIRTLIADTRIKGSPDGSETADR